ncbi:MAG: methyl-accepting chemotaxis protein [Acidobacteriota bacterium]|nr:MAG: methyl-accepting chemotaxis protein [Acidobacteriota bacterium]
MPRQITNSLFNSLRGRIWISTSVLAFFICTFGLISYLVVTLLVNDVFYGIFIPFLFLAFTVVVFGWWLSNEIVSPIEKVTLLSKSLERTSSTSLPKTSGSYETDELLNTLYRNSQQVQMLVTLMEKVAAGNLDVSLASLEGSDRLSATFQKLLSKVSESINAKEDLDRLQTAVEQIKREISPIRSGNLSARVWSEDLQTKEIAATVNYLIDSLSSIVELARNDSREAGELSKKIEKDLRELIQQDESRIDDLMQASITLKQVPNLVKKISEDLNNSSQSARQSIEKVQKGNQITAQNAESVSKLRKQMREAVKRVQSLNERTQEIGKLATTVEDLANRTNMVALNASIQAAELGDKGQGFALVAEEVERLAARANSTNRQIAALNKSVSTEIRKVENALELAGGEISGFSKYSIESGNILAELERYVAQFINLQENLVALAGDRSEESEQAFLKFVNSISEGRAKVDELRSSTKELGNLGQVLNNIQVGVSEYRVTVSSPDSDARPDSGHGGLLHSNEDTDLVASLAEIRNAGTQGRDVQVDDASPEESWAVPSFDDEPEEFGMAEYYEAGSAETETVQVEDILGYEDGPAT